MLKVAGIIFTLIFVINLQYASAQAEDSTQVVLEKTSADGTIGITIESNLPKAGSPLVINVRFLDAATGAILPNVNYDMVAMQNGEIVLSQMGLHTANGLAQFVTQPLTTDSHVEVMVILQGIGVDAPYSGPQGETIEVAVVPEFGALASIILLLSVGSAIILQKTMKLK